MPSGRVRRFLGHHPLLNVVGGRTVEVDTEFLDVTNLWWMLHFRVCPNNIEAGFNPWYLEPVCNDHPARLRVLLNTRVTPMVWFATLPREAGGATEDKPDLPDATTVGGYVFFRPIGSAYAYPSTNAGVLTEPKHATAGMRNLCRYLLQGHTRSQKTKITGLPDWHQLLDHSPDAVNPLGGYGFYPCGMEYALDRTAPRLLAENRSLRVLLLPVPDRDSDLGYGGITGPGNAGRVSAALRLLWSRGAFGGPGQQLLRSGEPASPTPPQSGLSAPAGGTLRVADDAWVGAYSSGGHALWALLKDPGNRATTSRVLVFDTVEFKNPGVDRLLSTAKARGRGLQVRIVWSPYAMGGPPPSGLLTTMRGLGTQTAVFPKTGAKYFQHPPNADNLWADYVFADAKPWKPEMFPPRKMNEWWHQFVVFAGEELHDDPRNPLSVSFMEATMAP
ncbi:hypothetical protein ACFS5L_13245 [Streptomyces phyllanthi]|uniref:Uncharacterized protein n=1 Tax=Streptomyces phyllanthi TaxID=1803180 RepID=A0A5N8W4C9_9ACTN|nr:hypothetical protein [Streptomyces phyllanthi]MPY42343.1 hypothetical protein [Streptomyces phyllanthi]